jgi:hypothetical protein
MSNISRYADQVLHDVRDFLWAVKENKGFATKSVREAKYAEYARESGRRRAIDIINIAYQAMGKNAILVQESNVSAVQIASFVERAKNDSRDILAEIKALREQKEQKKMSNTTPTPNNEEHPAPNPPRLVDQSDEPLTEEEEAEFQVWFEGLGITTKPYSPFEEK